MNFNISHCGHYFKVKMRNKVLTVRDSKYNSEYIWKNKWSQTSVVELKRNYKIIQMLQIGQMYDKIRYKLL